MNITATRLWTEATLGEIATIDRQSVQPENIKTGTTFIGLENITSEGLFTEVQTVEAGEIASNKFAFDSRHILYGKLRPYLKKIARPNFSGVCSTDILPIRPSSQIDRDFLCHYLRQPSYIDLATARSTGANLPRLSPKTLAEFPISFPPIATQKQIAAILDKADAVRRKRQEAIRLTEELLRSAFLEMFGDPGKNPNKWPTGYVADIAEIVTDGTHQTPEHAESGVMLLSARNIQNGFIDISEAVDFVPRHEYERLSKSYNPEPHDVLISCSGSVGRVTVVRDFGSFSMVRSVAVIRPKLDLINSEFLESLLHSAYLRASMIKGSKQSSQANLFQGAIRELPIILPPLTLQEQWKTYKLRLKEASEKYSKMQNDLTNLFNSLLQRAFRGDL